MRIACPNCQATYEVPDSMLARGPARVRCARCATEWAPEAAAAPQDPARPTPFSDALVQTMASQPAPEPDPPPPAAEPAPAEPAPPPEPAAAPRLDAPPRPPIPPPNASGGPLPSPRRAARRQRDPITVLFAWSLSVGIVIALVIVAYVHHADIVAAWPPAARAYDLIGIR